MARASNANEKKTDEGANVGYEAELWMVADRVARQLGRPAYKHVS